MLSSRSLFTLHKHYMSYLLLQAAVLYTFGWFHAKKHASIARRRTLKAKGSNVDDDDEATRND